MDILSPSSTSGKTLELPSKTVEIFNEPTDDASLLALVKQIDPVGGEATLAALKRGIHLPEGALAKLSDDELAVYAGKLLAFVKVLARAIFLYATDEQFVRLFPPIARLMRAVYSEVTKPIEGQMGGANAPAFEEWAGDFLPKGDVMRGGVGEEVTQPQVTAQTLQLAQALQSGQLALEGQKQQLDMQKLQMELLQSHVTSVQSATKTQVTRAELAKRILQQADPATPLAQTLNAVVYSLVVEGVLVATVYYGGKGIAGVGLLLTIVLIEFYTAWTSFSLSNSMSKVGGAVGAGAFAVVTGVAGGLTNGVTNLFGFGNVVGTEEPAALNATQAEKDILGGPYEERPEQVTIAKTRAWSIRIDEFLSEMGRTLFGETDPALAQTFQLCFVGIVFFVLFYFVRHLLDVLDEARIKRKVDIANNIQFNQQVTSASLPPMLAMANPSASAVVAPPNLAQTTMFPPVSLGNLLPSAPASAPALSNAAPALTLTNQGGSEKKKRRTFRNRKAKKNPKTRAVSFKY